MPSSTLQLLVSFPSINRAKTLEYAPFTESLLSLILQPTIKLSSPLFYNARFLTQRPRFAIRVESKPRSSQFRKGSAPPDAKRRKEIVLFDAPPQLLEESGGRGGIVGGGRVTDKKRKDGGFNLLFLIKKLPKRVLSALSNLTLAIAEMFTIATLMALGLFS